MLAIKSVPMPTTCGNCMFGRSLMDTFGDAYCAIFPTLPTQVGVRPDWCPLEDVPQRMRGRWERTVIGKARHIRCSVCKVGYYAKDVPHDLSGNVAWKYCPECGAAMEEQNEEG